MMLCKDSCLVLLQKGTRFFSCYKIEFLLISSFHFASFFLQDEVVENFFVFHNGVVRSVSSPSSMTIILSALAFVILLTLLLLIHEAGHYLLARLFDVDVEEFGFGLPPRAKVLFKRKKTLFTLNWVPFGAFVRLKGENAVEHGDRMAKGSFAHAAIWKRFLILSGGVFMNFILAIGLLTVGFSFGHWVPSAYESVEELEAAAARGEISMQLGVVISGVAHDSPAASRGITAGTELISIDGEPVEKPAEVLELHKGKSTVTYVLGMQSGEQKTIDVPLKDGRAGIEISSFPKELSAPNRSLIDGFVLALRETKFMTKQTILGMGQLVGTLVRSAKVPEGITGIVGIAVLTYGSVQEGFMTYVRLVALLSLSLAILNILPLPALDGGRLLFLIVEAVIRRPLNRKFELLTNAVGFFLIIGLIVVITFNDIIQIVYGNFMQ